MKHSPKENVERFYLMVLRDQFSNLPAEEPVKGERPDFVWPNLEQPLGVEITRLFKDTPQGQRPTQVQESERKATIEIARRLYEQRHLPNLDIRIIFGSNPINKSDRNMLAKKLTDAVQKHLPASNSCVQVHNDFSVNCSLPEEISYLSIARLDSLDRNSWSVSDAGWVQENFIDELQRRINKKNVEFPHYMRRCCRCWLLVIADGDGPSSFLQPNEDTKQHIYYSLFHRTFFMEAFTRRVIELDTMANVI